MNHAMIVAAGHDHDRHGEPRESAVADALREERGQIGDGMTVRDRVGETATDAERAEGRDEGRKLGADDEEAVEGADSQRAGEAGGDAEPDAGACDHRLGHDHTR